VGSSQQGFAGAVETASVGTDKLTTDHWSLITGFEFLGLEPDGRRSEVEPAVQAMKGI
jgi:hypothetical protein